MFQATLAKKGHFMHHILFKNKLFSLKLFEYLNLLSWPTPNSSTPLKFYLRVLSTYFFTDRCFRTHCQLTQPCHLDLLEKKTCIVFCGRRQEVLRRSVVLLQDLLHVHMIESCIKNYLGYGQYVLCNIYVCNN